MILDNGFIMAHNHRPDESLTKLTEFAPLSSDTKPAGFLQRLFGKSAPDSSGSTTPVADSAQLLSDNLPAEASDHASQHEEDIDVLLNSGHDNLNEASADNQTRTLSSVLRRLGTILDRRSQTPQAYKDSDFKQYWMPDSNCKECYECGDKFNTFRRRHHCRICGQIFCSRCCNQEVPGKIMGYTGYLRVCTYCCKVVLSYAQNIDSTADLHSLSTDLQHLSVTDVSQESTSTTCSETGTSNLQTPTMKRKHSRGMTASIFDDEQPNPGSDLPSPSSTINPFDVTPQTEYCSIYNFLQERKLLTQDSAQLRYIWNSMQDPIDGIETQSHRLRLRTYHSCIIGNEMVNWLLARDKVTSRAQGVAIGQALVDANYLECITTTDGIFRDAYSLYKHGEGTTDTAPPNTQPPNTSTEPADLAGPEWFREIKTQDDQSTSLSTLKDVLMASTKSSECADNLSTSVESSVTTVKPSPRVPHRSKTAHIDKNSVVLPHQDSVVGPGIITEDLLKGALSVGEMCSTENKIDSWQGTEHLREENGEKIAYERISKTQLEHIIQLTQQLLHAYGLHNKWSDVVLTLVHKVSHVVRPDVRHEGDSMDIRNYVQIKKIPGGDVRKTSMIFGVVCTKNVAHRKMETSISNPKILLLRSPIEYQRVEKKYSSLEPQILQEHKYLKNCVSRIASLQPDIILVEKSVSRVAQEFLVEGGFTLVINVKPSVMERVARFTQADIITSIDGFVSKTELGLCHQFQLQKYVFPDGTQKTLMYFDGCAAHLGCTIALRGGSSQELRKVKNIVRFLVYCAYHSRLETSFLMDEFALPPSLAGELDISALSNDGPSDDNIVLVGDATDNDGHSSDEVEEATEICDDSSNITKNVPINVTDGDTPAPLVESKSEDTPFIPNTNTTTCTTLSSGRSSREKPQPSEEIIDFSDPLHIFQKAAETTPKSLVSPDIVVKSFELPERNKMFKKHLDDSMLSVSPLLRYDIPYLETASGCQCALRQFITETYYSDVWCEYGGHEKVKKFSMEMCMEQSLSPLWIGVKGEHTDSHAFTTAKLSQRAESMEAQTLLADFRARGGMIIPVNNYRPKTKSAAAKVPNPFYFKIDCLDPLQHQRLAVLFLSFSYESPNSPNPCVKPWVVLMDFYGRNDVPLGSFLERYCFREMYRCPSESCDTPMVDHVRRFVHSGGCIQIVLKKLEQAIPSQHNNILMWSWCKKCKQVTPVVPMSLDTWSMSFAKYLELRFHGTTYSRRGSMESCTHSIHHDHYQYFGCKKIVASFRYYPVTLKEILLPASVVGINPISTSYQSIIEDATNIALKGSNMFSSVTDHWLRIKPELQNESWRNIIDKYGQQIKNEKDAFRLKMDTIQHKIAQYASQSNDTLDSHIPGNVVHGYIPPEQLCEVLDNLVDIKLVVNETASVWNCRITEFEQQRKIEKTRSPSIARPTREINQIVAKNAIPAQDTTSSTQPWNSSVSSREESCDSDVTFIVGSTDKSIASIRKKQRAFSDDSECPDPTDDRHHPAPTADHVTTSGDVTTASRGSSVSDVPGSECLDGANMENTLQSYDNKVPSEHQVEKTEHKGHHRSKSLGDSKRLSKQLSIPHDSSGSDLDKLEKKTSGTVKNLLSSLMFHPESTGIEMPFEAGEHYVISPECKMPIVIYDEEPSSIIAYTLSSVNYEEQLQTLKMNHQSSISNSPALKRNKKEGLTDSSEVNMDTGRRSSVLSFLRVSSARDKSPNRKCASKIEIPKSDASSRADVDSVRYTPPKCKGVMEESDDFSNYFNGKEAEKNIGDQNNDLHIELQFSDNSTKFYCRVYFAEHFVKLRKLIFPAGEERYIRSLSRCITWSARGGKSGSSFCKTQDDRFILKQMSRLEVQSFLEFAPHYIQYCINSINEQKPSVLAKILGVYRIGYRNTETNSALRQDLLVMENLFYDRKVNQIYDLKGSVRNRLVNTQGKKREDFVLLDENLLKMSVDSPLYIRGHSKSVLTQAITNDTHFLSGKLVMDYSLLVGVDETRKELIVGIIDYIRTFTWDKKLEMVFKTTYSQLGGQGKMPTVVSPEMYRTRFLQAMDQYFLMVPDRWTGLTSNLNT